MWFAKGNVISFLIVAMLLLGCGGEASVETTKKGLDKWQGLPTNYIALGNLLYLKDANSRQAMQPFKKQGRKVKETMLKRIRVKS